jgi:hypothetical protein
MAVSLSLIGFGISAAIIVAWGLGQTVVPDDAVKWATGFAGLIIGFWLNEFKKGG